MNKQYKYRNASTIFTKMKRIMKEVERGQCDRETAAAEMIILCAQLTEWTYADDYTLLDVENHIKEHLRKGK